MQPDTKRQIRAMYRCYCTNFNPKCQPRDGRIPHTFFIPSGGIRLSARSGRTETAKGRAAVPGALPLVIQGECSTLAPRWGSWQPVRADLSARRRYASEQPPLGGSWQVAEGVWFVEW